jgi:hypothetical protein
MTILVTNESTTSALTTSGAGQGPRVERGNIPIDLSCGEDCAYCAGPETD